MLFHCKGFKQASYIKTGQSHSQVERSDNVTISAASDEKLLILSVAHQIYTFFMCLERHSTFFKAIKLNRQIL